MDYSAEKIKKLNEIIKKQKSQIFQLKNVIDNVPVSVYWKNIDGAYLGFNKSGAESARKFNLPHTEKEVLGKTDHDIFPKIMADNFRENDLEVIQKNIELVKEEFVVFPSGDKATQLSTKKPLHDEKGNVCGVIGSTVDITKLKEIESELKIAKEDAEKANLLKNEFIENMEHDIRTPFSGIYGLAHILWRKEKNKDKKTALFHIVNTAKQLLDYCNAILDFSKSQSGNFPVVDKNFDVHELVQNVINMEIAAATAKNIKLSSSVKNTPRFIIGDDYRLTRILLNLVSNAVKFTPEGHVKLKVKGHKQKAKMIILEFVVEDSGIGIPKEKQEFIGEAFVRFSPSNKGKYKGLGLGIPVIKKFIYELGGELELESEVNKGSKFTCIIPFKLPFLSKK